MVKQQGSKAKLSTASISFHDKAGKADAVNWLIRAEAQVLDRYSELMREEARADQNTLTNSRLRCAAHEGQHRTSHQPRYAYAQPDIADY